MESKEILDKLLTERKKSLWLVVIGLAFGILCIILGIFVDFLFAIIGFGSIFLAVLHLAWVSKDIEDNSVA